MAQLQLNHQLARITGEPLGTLKVLGFSILRPDDEGDYPEDIGLVLNCPFCGRPVPYPGRGGGGSELLAECDRCDVYFEFDPSDVYTVDADSPVAHRPGADRRRRPQ
jgi:hypothetical protein